MANEFIIRKGYKSFSDSQITGSLSVSNAVTASFFTGSFRGDGSELTGIDGFPFTGSASISGSLVVVGPVTATEFIGDGSQLTGIDGFPFTGSAAISGSLIVDGNVIADSFTGSIQGTATSASYVNIANVNGFTAYSSSVNTAIGSVLDATTPLTATINNTNSPFTITSQSIVIVDSTNGNVTVNLPDLNTIVGTPAQRPILIYKNDYSQNVIFVTPSGSQLVNGTSQDIIVSIQIAVAYNPTSEGFITEGTSAQSLAELELFFLPLTQTGSLSVATASYVEYTDVVNKPTLVSGSSQISFSGITNKPSLVSGSAQVSFTGIINKPTLVSGSSQVTYSGLTGIPSGIVSSSVQVKEYNVFATTGSNQFNGNQSITGSLIVSGQVVAQTLNVQEVTSSVVFSSGSNVFGNSLGNTQQFTGSMLVTGSLAVNGTAAILGSGTPNTIPKFTAGSTLGNSLVFDNGTNVGIGINNPTAGRLQINVSDTTTAAHFQLADGTTTLANSFVTNFRNANDGNGRYSLSSWQAQNAVGNDQIGFIGVQSVTGGSNYTPNIVFGQKTGVSTYATRMTLDTSGNLGLGVTPSAWNANSKALQLPSFISLSQQNSGALNLMSYALETSGNAFTYADTGVFPARLNMNPNDGTITLFGAGTGTVGNAITWTPRLAFTSAGAATFTGALNGTSAVFSGDVGVVKSSPLYYLQNSTSITTASRGDLAWYNSAISTVALIRASAITDNVGTSLDFFTRPVAGSLTQVLTLASTGNVGIGIDSPGSRLHVRNLTGGNTPSNYLQIEGSIADNSNYPGIVLKGGTLATSYPNISLTNGGLALVLSNGIATAYNNPAQIFLNNGTINFATGDNAGATQRMIITSGGSVIVGASYMTYPVSIEAFAGGSQLALTRSGAVAEFYMGGTTGGTTQLYIRSGGSGGVRLDAGGTSWIPDSDIRLKDIEKYIENAVESLSTLQTICYSWKNSDNKSLHLGLIAQEVEAVFPEIVSESSITGMKGVNYMELIPVLIKATQEQQSQIEILKAEIQTLKQ